MRYLMAMMLVLMACRGTGSSSEQAATTQQAATSGQPFLPDEARALAIYDSASPGQFQIVCSGQIAITNDNGTAGGTWTCSRTRDATTGALVGTESGAITGTISGENLSLVLGGGANDFHVTAHVVTTGTLHRLDGTVEVAGASHLFQAWNGRDVLRTP